MKLKTRILSILLALGMVVSLLPASALAANGDAPAAGEPTTVEETLPTNGEEKTPALSPEPADTSAPEEGPAPEENAPAPIAEDESNAPTDVIGAALAAAEPVATVELTEDYTGNVTVPAGKTLELTIVSGVTLTGTITVEEGGTLTVAGEGTVNGGSANAILNNGTVTLNGGVFTVAGGGDVFVNHGFMEINAGTRVEKTEGDDDILIINGWKNKTEEDAAPSNATATLKINDIQANGVSLANYSWGNLTIAGGTFENSARALQNYHIATITGGTFSATDGTATIYATRRNGAAAGKQDSKLTITGGTFKAAGTTSFVMNTGNDAASIEIKGGTFDGLFPNADTLKGTITVTGGDFQYDVSGFVIDSGMTAQKGEDGRFHIVVDPTSAKIRIGLNSYATLADAMEAAKTVENPIIELLGTVTLDSNIAVNTAATLNLNGQTLETNGYTITVETGAKLTVTGNGTVNCSAADLGDNRGDSLYRMFQVNVGGELVIENGTYTTNSYEFIYCEGTATVLGGTFTCNWGYDAKCAMVASGEQAVLTVKGGSVRATSDQRPAGNTKPCYGMYGIYVKTGAKLVLGDAATKTGPEVVSYEGAIGLDNTTSSPAVVIDIYGGDYEVVNDFGQPGSVSSGEKFNAVLYLSGNSTVNIAGGNFHSSNYSTGHVISLPYKKADTSSSLAAKVELTITGGEFIAQGGADVFYVGDGVTVPNGISDGRFSSDVKGYVTDTAICEKDSDLFVVRPLTAEDEEAVASVNGVCYKTLQTAINAGYHAQQPAVLLRNLDLGDKFAILYKGNVLDLNGCTLTSRAQYTIATVGDSTIQNGTVRNTNQEEADPKKPGTQRIAATIYAQDSIATLNNVNVESKYAGILAGPGSAGHWGGLVLTGTNNIYGAFAGAAVFGDNADGTTSSLRVTTGSTITGGAYGLAGNGSWDNTEIIITGGTVAFDPERPYQFGDLTYESGLGIYHPQQGKLTITGGTISGDVGLQVCGGEVTIGGNAIIRSIETEVYGDPAKPSSQKDGSIQDGSALSVVSRKSYGDVTVTVTGGTFETANAQNASISKYGAEKDPDGNWVFSREVLLTNVSLAVSGGTFDSDVTEYCVEGKEAHGQENGTYIVGDKSYAAQVGDTKYETLQAAVAVGGEVILLRDVTESVVIDGTVTLDLNGKTLTGATTHAITNNGTLTIVDSSAEKTGTVDGGSISASGAIFNNVGATAHLNGGTFTGSKWYVVKNLGTMTIDGATVDQKDLASSGIANGWFNSASTTGVANDCGVAHSEGATAILTIEDGTFTGGLNTVKNDDFGVLTVNGGTHSNTTQHVIMNWNQATITGGTFDGPNGRFATISNNGDGSDANLGSMSISGGTFDEVLPIDYLAPDKAQNGTYEVLDAAVTLDSSAADTTVGASVTLNADVTPAGAVVTWTSSDEAVATVENGVVTGVSLGSAVITVTVGNVNATCTVTVNAIPVTGITLDAESLALTVGGENGTLTATVAPANATDKSVTWSSSDETVATVENGVVTPVGAGTAIITVTTANDLTATCTVTVTVPVTGVTLDAETLSLTVGGENGTLTATVAPENATDKSVTWSSSDETVATVENGVVTPVGAGTAIITVTTANDLTATCTVTVTVPVTGVTLDAETLSLTVGGQTGTLTATVAPDNATDKSVTWSSSDETVATVTNGVVTPVGAGTAIITVTAANGLTATCEVTVRTASVTPPTPVTPPEENIDDPDVPLARPFLFTDVKEGDWFYESVKYAWDNNLMDGVSETLFAPHTEITRGMVVTILHRLEDTPEAQASSFSDVAAGTWYSDAVNWAEAHDIVNGFEDGTFRPTQIITREQMAAILYRYASYKGYDVSARGSLDSFADGVSTSGWARDNMAWGVGAQLFSGKSGNLLDPTGSATRAEAAKLLMSFCQQFMSKA